MSQQIPLDSGTRCPLDRRRFLALGGLGLGALPFSMRAMAAHAGTLDARLPASDDF